MSDAPALKGFSYHVTDEQIRRWMEVPLEDRLRWLTEANSFLLSAQDKETREIWERFRRGNV
jgi:hypothetical protein